MTKRYFVPDLAETGGSVALPPTEAQHATRVMRVKVGDDVELFNGLGLQAAARIIEIGRNRCVCGTEHATLVDREPKRMVNMAIALPKPERAKELVERLTELESNTSHHSLPNAPASTVRIEYGQTQESNH